MTPVTEAQFEGTKSKTASKAARPASAMSTKGKILAQKLKEREREYGVKRTTIDQKLATEKKESRRLVLVKHINELEAEYWDVLEAKSFAKSAKKVVRRSSASTAKKARPSAAKAT